MSKRAGLRRSWPCCGIRGAWNCHSSRDFPRQGDDSHPHIMTVRRGPDGHGVNAVMCSTCHGEHNLGGTHMPPGAPDGALPSAATPMVLERLDDRQLCLLLKDPQQNGHRSMDTSWSTCTRRLCCGDGALGRAGRRSLCRRSDFSQTSMNGSEAGAPARAMRPGSAR